MSRVLRPGVRKGMDRRPLVKGPINRHHLRRVEIDMRRRERSLQEAIDEFEPEPDEPAAPPVELLISFKRQEGAVAYRLDGTVAWDHTGNWDSGSHDPHGGVRVSPDGKHVAIYDSQGGRVWIRDAPTGGEVAFRDSFSLSFPRAAGWISDSEVLVLGRYDLLVCDLELDTVESLALDDNPFSSTGVVPREKRDVMFRHDSDELTCVDVSNGARLWGTSLGGFSADQISGRNLAPAPDGSVVLAAASGDRIALFDGETGSQIWANDSLPGGISPGGCGQVALTSSWAYLAYERDDNGDNLYVVLDRETGSLEHEVGGLGSGRDDEQALAVSFDGSRLWVPPEGGGSPAAEEREPPDGEVVDALDDGDPHALHPVPDQ